ncbi:MAG TPA: DUF2382 domain-containing protein [Nocardioidaceae bacterium]|nr:DUF2382 domain-containing protein [Nocardioidaceae bacterium]
MTSHHPSAEALHGMGGVTAPGSPDAVPAGDTAEVIRSEERLDIARTSEVAGRVRIAKRVVTEERQVTVTVRREELVVEELPADAGAATSAALADGDGLVQQSTGAAHASEPVLELWLSEEEVEVSTRVVPRERVRVYVDTVTDSVEVAETVGKEVVDVTEAGATTTTGTASAAEPGPLR